MMKVLLTAVVSVFLFAGCGGSGSAKPKKKKNVDLEESTPFKGGGGISFRPPVSW